MIRNTLGDDDTQSDIRENCALLLNLGSTENSRENIDPNTYKFLEGR
jgi:hypothetical protein